jgi:excinuclease ABC subunit A
MDVIKKTDAIRILGARQHNLKNVHLEIPKNKLVVITGLSGSGKSSLAFDTLYAEGQRRYVESLSAYARQFLEMMEKPDVDSIEGLSPSISIEQKTTSRNPRSTVGTVTEIYDYLRLLFARLGVPYSPMTGQPIESQTVSQMVERVMGLSGKILLMAPLARGKKGEFRKEVQNVSQSGFSRLKVDGELMDIDAFKPLDKNKKHDIYVVIDRLVLPEGGGGDAGLLHNDVKILEKDHADRQRRVAEGIEAALQISKDLVVIEYANSQQMLLSAVLCCPESGFSLGAIEPRLFSFNNPYGACFTCGGTGKNTYDFSLSPSKNLHAWGQNFREILETSDDRYDDEGDVCAQCQGNRLKSEALCVRIQGNNIAEVSNLSILDAAQWARHLITVLSPTQMQIGAPILREIQQRLDFLLDVGLDYLTISRASGTLSGGETQRIRLASQIGSGLTGVLYVLDEPSIGLHQRDNDRLLGTLKRLRDLGNTVLVVEHDEDAMIHADHIIDMGPRAGRFGGQVVAQGQLKDILKACDSLTGAYLRGDLKMKSGKNRPINPQKMLTLKGCTLNNLQNIDVQFPLGLFVAISGVSGSGKSSLVMESLYPALNEVLNNRDVQRQISQDQESVALEYEPKKGHVIAMSGFEHVDKIIHIDQAPIGRTPRSNPATYTGAFTPIREWFAQLPEAKTRGYHPGRFSFNVSGGRCEACSGEGEIKIAMHFLPDVYVPCEACKGRRYGKETLEVRFKDYSIADILECTVEQALEIFESVPCVAQKLETLMKVGLGYLHVGQKATTLSGGEAQRVKLAKELSKRSTGRTLYILDEPTTGLHFEDIAQLLGILNLLVDQGNTVIVIEHNLDVLKTADWLIDVGPEGGHGGGRIVIAGTPDEVASCDQSWTGRYLKKDPKEDIRRLFMQAEKSHP